MPKIRKMENNNKAYYLTAQACEMAKINRGMIFGWIREGIIPEPI